jgi:aminoglycoside phosphotransferase (APT) family kinase protein
VSKANRPSKQVQFDDQIVGRLIAEQFPEWAALPLVEVTTDGTDNRLYRLGDDLVVRLPRLPSAAETVRNEQYWLPRIAPGLPLDIPVPLGAGVPDDTFPYPWSVYRWLHGANLVDQPASDLPDTAIRLGRFVAVLQRIDTTGGPVSARAAPVDPADDPEVRRRIRQLGAEGLLDAETATAIWETALAAPKWVDPPVWIHSDLYPGNLIAQHGHLSAVIDFGLLGLGDPACDLLPAWALLTTETRELFRSQTGVNEATWIRGRGWALSAGLGAVDVYRNTNPTLAIPGQHAITQATADYRRTA